MRYLIIDGNHCGFAANDSPRLSVGDIQTNAVFGFLRSLRGYLEAYKGIPIVCWDGRAQWRFDLWPLYKGNRDADPKMIQFREGWREQRKLVVEILKSLGVAQITGHNEEADDIAFKLSRKFSREGHEVVLITGDKDWLQMLQFPGVRWEDPKNRRGCVPGTFAEFTGFKTVQQFVQAKALNGDGSDNIPGVGGFGSVAIKELFDRFDKVDDLLDLGDMAGPNDIGGFMTTLSRLQLALAKNETPKPSKKWGEMAPMREAYARNLKLMDLSLAPAFDTSERKLERGAFDRERFLEWCLELNFRSIERSTDWLDPFEKVAK